MQQSTSPSPRPGPARRLLSVVVPVFNEEEAVGLFVSTMAPHLDALDFAWEIVFANDGSRDDTLARLIALNAADPRVKIVDLSRNFGKEAAMTAGVEHAAGDVVLVMDVDLQDPPELIAPMIAKWREGYDVVYGERVSRGNDSAIKRMTAGQFYSLYNRISAVKIPANVGDFRLMDRKVVDALNAMPERVRFMKGLFAWVGFKSAAIPYERPPRQAGETKFNYWKLWNFAIDGITSFSTVPLRVWSYFGSIIALVAFLYGSYLIIRTIVFGIDVPGYISTFVAVLFFGGIQLIGLGIIGEYLGRVYSEVKHRPVYLVAGTYGIKGKPPTDPAARQP